MHQSLDPAGLQALYTSGEQLLLPHAHAARTVRARLADVRPLASAPEPKPALAWNEWTASLWSYLLLEGHDDRLLLNRLQEEQLWAEIITANAPGATPVVVRDLAPKARAAFQRAAAFRVLDRLRNKADTADSRTFALLMEDFRNRCARQRLLSTSLLEDALGVHLKAGSLPSPDPLHLIGFEQESPAQQHLLAALAGVGTTVHRHNLRSAQTHTGIRISTALPDNREQLRFAVRYIAHGARRQSTHSPTVALICPNPEDLRPELERLFREILAPELESVHADLSSTPWHFTTQPPLSTAPISAAALDLLRWLISPLPLERIGQLLLSPFFRHTDIDEVRARFEPRVLRRFPIVRPALDLSGFLPLLRTQTSASRGSDATFPELRALLRVSEQEKLSHTRRSFAEWTDVVRQLLKRVGWPGPRTLSPAEFHSVEAWEHLLDLLATLQFQPQRISFAMFLDRLTEETRNLRRPGENVAAPVQVLTLAETEGLTFDLAVVLDATDQNLPVVHPRHQLLPQGLQRRLGFGDPVQALAQTRASLDSLALRSAQTLLLTAAAEDDSPTQRTPLAEQLGFRPVNASLLFSAETAIVPVPTEAAPVPETLPSLHNVEVAGGAEVLRLQAACGFRAFASLRLGGKELQTRDLGLQSLETGSILHTAMETFWAEVKTQAALRALPAQSRRELVTSATRRAIARLRLQSQTEDPWSASFLGVVEKRFTTLLLRWLDLELQRSPFTVLAQEQQQTLTLGPIRLKLRPDRVDAVEDGIVFVDYKSSYDLSVSQWLNPRPDAPQLPAYALFATPDRLEGIAFAQIRPDQKTLGWISLSHRLGTFPRARGKQVDLRVQAALWRDELTRLAEDFAAGDTRVDPKSYPQTCQFCAHRLLCRLDPATLLAQAEADDDLLEDEENHG